jgi:hypothetical protein
VAKTKLIDYSYSMSRALQTVNQYKDKKTKDILSDNKDIILGRCG